MLETLSATNLPGSAWRDLPLLPFVRLRLDTGTLRLDLTAPGPSCLLHHGWPHRLAPLEALLRPLLTLTWHSDSPPQTLATPAYTSAGRGWSLPMDAALWRDVDGVCLRLPDGTGLPIDDAGQALLQERGQLTVSDARWHLSIERSRLRAQPLHPFSAQAAWLMFAAPTRILTRLPLLGAGSTAGWQLRLETDSQDRPSHLLLWTPPGWLAPPPDQAPPQAIPPSTLENRPSDPHALIRMLLRRDLAGRVSSLAVEAPGWPRGTLRWMHQDDRDRLLEVSWPPGILAQASYDQAHRLTRLVRPGLPALGLSWDGRGRCQGLELGSQGWQIQYEPGRTRILPPLGTAWTFHLDGAGRVVAVEEGKNARRRLMYSPEGMLLESVDSLNRSLSLRYDPLGPLKVLGLPDERWVALEVDADRRLVGLQEEDGSSWRWQAHAPALGSTLRAADGAPLTQDLQPACHDPAETPRQQAISSWLGAGMTALPAEEGSFPTHTPQQAEIIKPGVLHLRDACGGTSQLTCSPAGVLRGVVTAAGAEWAWMQDDQGRLSGLEPPVGSSLRVHRPDPYTVEIYQADERLLKLKRDGEGRLVAREGRDGQEERFVYSPEGQLLSWERPNRSWHFEYDLAGRLRKRWLSQEGQDRPRVEHYTYNRQGWVMTAQGPEVEVVLSRDAGGCLVDERIHIENTSGPDPTFLTQSRSDFFHQYKILKDEINTYYTNRERSINPFSDGIYGRSQIHTWQLGPAKSRLQLRQDACGRTEHLLLTAQGLTLLDRRYAWDTTGRLAGVEDPSRGSDRFSYDRAGRLESYAHAPADGSGHWLERRLVPLGAPFTAPRNGGPSPTHPPGWSPQKGLLFDPFGRLIRWVGVTGTCRLHWQGGRVVGIDDRHGLRRLVQLAARPGLIEVEPSRHPTGDMAEHLLFDPSGPLLPVGKDLHLWPGTALEAWWTPLGPCHKNLLHSEYYQRERPLSGRYPRPFLGADTATILAWERRMTNLLLTENGLEASLEALLQTPHAGALETCLALHLPPVHDRDVATSLGKDATSGPRQPPLPAPSPTVSERIPGVAWLEGLDGAPVRAPWESALLLQAVQPVGQADWTLYVCGPEGWPLVGITDAGELTFWGRHSPWGLEESWGTEVGPWLEAG